MTLKQLFAIKIPIEKIASYSTVGFMADQVAENKGRLWRVPEHLTDIRLDAFVRKCLPHISRKEIDAAVREKLFLINGRVAKKGQQLCAGDTLAFDGPEQRLATEPPADFEIDVPIVYEDPVILVLNKPAGIATHGFSGRDTGTLANFLLSRWPGLSAIGKSRWEPGLVHRLDSDTSGLIVIAKTQTAFENLRLQFQRRQITKKYLALVGGKTPAEGTIEESLMHDPRDSRKMHPVKALSRKSKHKAWRAVTHYRKLGEADNVSLLEIEMITGVTHQIRVHLASIGHAIIGDILYGAGSGEAFGLKHHFLHASRLAFSHPSDGRTLSFDGELPVELRMLLERLGLKI
jgi:23S rRNA pseudouridine1911/1915/1917 synthase